jgi:thioredoxin 2
MQLVCPSCLTANRVPEGRLGDQPVCGRCRARLLPREPLALTDATFDAYIGGSDLPVLVDFWAEWCGPCQMMHPILAELASHRSDICIAKVDTMIQTRLPARYQIRGIPALLLMRRGVELGRLVGAVSAQKLVTWIDTTLQRAAAGAGS